MSVFFVIYVFSVISLYLKLNAIGKSVAEVWLEDYLEQEEYLEEEEIKEIVLSYQKEQVWNKFIVYSICLFPIGNTLLLMICWIWTEEIIKGTLRKLNEIINVNDSNLEDKENEL